MKEVWFFITILLTLSILAAVSGMTTPTSAFIANLPPEWDHPTTTFKGTQLTFDLDKAFFDPDGDKLSYGAIPQSGISAGINQSTLIALTETGGTLTVIASDGKTVTKQTITLTP